jgi:hypothetical protein
MIFILELICDPHDHVLESIAWDDDTHAAVDAAFQLGHLALPVLPVCRECGSTSTRLRNLPTHFETTAAAAESRLGCAVLS